MKYERFSDKAINIVNELHRERLDYYSEYTPLIDTLNRLAEYEDKIEAGTLVKLPCKVGDTVYRIWCDESTMPVRVIRIIIASETICFDTSCGNFLLGEFGKTIFLTKAEAEKRLEELRGER